ncbi:MAG: GNAT family N-acetyltransferase [Kofleriaceae bacterium]
MIHYEPLGQIHAEGLFAALSPPETHRYLSQPDVTTLEALRDRIDRLVHGPASWINYVVLVDGVIVGRLEATRYDDYAEIAYVIGPAYQRRGYGREGVRWLVDVLATECWASIHPDNARSIHLVETLGFTRQPTPPARPLSSYEEGDVVLSRTSRA